MRALFTAATGMKAQQLKVDNIANNLANVNTNGFKKSQAEFEDLYYQKVRTGTGQTQQGTGAADQVEIGHGTRASQVRRIFTQGSFQSTGNATDMAIQGDGFFAVNDADGNQLYTRTGNFTTDASGNLVLPNGFALADGIVIPAEGGDLAIGDDGIVKLTSGETTTELGQIQLHTFTNPSGLEAVGAGMYRASEASGTVQTGIAGSEGYGSIGSGMLEMSNVEVAEELIAMIQAQRAYELTSKVIEASDEMLQTTNQLK